MAEPTVHVEGLKELERAFKLADKEEAKLLRSELKLAAEPVKLAAQGKALSRIGHMTLPWAQMRIGQSRSVVYMVPKQKGRRSKANSRLRRPNLKRLLMDLAMAPALQEQASNVEARVEHVLETVAKQWERT